MTPHPCKTTTCDNTVSDRRVQLGYDHCLPCGEAQARAARRHWCVAPAYNKGAYQLITDPDDMKATNPRRTV